MCRQCNLNLTGSYGTAASSKLRLYGFSRESYIVLRTPLKPPRSVCTPKFHHRRTSALKLMSSTGGRQLLSKSSPRRSPPGPRRKQPPSSHAPTQPRATDAAARLRNRESNMSSTPTHRRSNSLEEQISSGRSKLRKTPQSDGSRRSSFSEGERADEVMGDAPPPVAPEAVAAALARARRQCGSEIEDACAHETTVKRRRQPSGGCGEGGP